MAKLVFLGRLEDIAGTPEIELDSPRGATLAQVMAGFPAELAAALSSPRIRIAVNGAVLGADEPLDRLALVEGDEIAFLPPVSGG
ncbi:MAG: MoaD/ThiS family protein [Novosphingobium sp.]